jgi:hypothetical protein
LSTSKKAPNALDTDVLLDVLETSEDNIEVIGFNYKNDILVFLSTFNIQKGEDNIKPHTLYSIYKVWSKDPIPKNAFYGEISQFIPKSLAYYKINQNVIKLTHEAYSRFKQENRRLKSKPWTRHFEKFLVEYNLKSEDFWVEAPILYFIYDKYTNECGLDDHPSTHMSKQVFFTYADLFLKHKKTKTDKFYAVNDNILKQFQDGQLDRMRKTYAQEQKAKKPKKQRRKPRPRSSV